MFRVRRQLFSNRDTSSGIEACTYHPLNKDTSLIGTYLQVSPHLVCFNAGMEDVAVIFGQPQLLIVDLPFADSMEEFAQQDSMVSEVLEAVHHLDTSYTAFYTALSDVDNEIVRQKFSLLICPRFQ